LKDVDEGVSRLESVLGGTRMNAERALRELHRAMHEDLLRAERRAERAERRVEALRGKLRRARRRAKRAESRLVTSPQPAPDLPRRLAKLGRKARHLRQG
jgi:hypothetical protein